MSRYTILDLAQGTPEWHAERAKRVTASDLACLWDEHKYKTRLDYFREKLTGVEKPALPGREYVLNRGHAWEIAARDTAERLTGLSLPPVVLVSDRAELLASLDGWDPNERVALEAKFVGTDTVQALKEQGVSAIPRQHYIQMQGQLFVTEGRGVAYLVTDDNGNAHMLEVMPDPALQEEIPVRVEEFMGWVREGKEPKPSERDWVELEDPAFARLMELKLAADKAKQDFEAFKDFVIEKYSHPRIRAGALEIVRTLRKGSVDYKRVPGLEGVDLERFRSAPVESVTVSVRKKKEPA